MGRFDRNNNNRRDSDRQITMHSAICDACGRECKVPFKPSGDKPIYCSSCFEQQGGGRDRDDRRRDSRDSRNSRDDRDFRDSGDRGGKGMYSAICDDCGNKCLVPFKPSSDKPIYCSSCFEKRGNSHDGGESKGSNNNKQSEQLDIIIEKLERIILVLEPKSTPVEKKVAKKKIEKKEPVKKKAIKKAKKE